MSWCKDDDRFGEGVNLAARVQGCSPPGGMAVSKWMHEYLTGKTELSFTDIGPQRLKNIGHTVRVFVWHPDPNLQQRFANRSLSLTQKGGEPSHRPSVAVLPFENFSTDPEQAHFADAVVEEITATLSRIGDFLVIARNSAFTYKGRQVDVRQVGRELGVRYVVEGSVRRVGERVRITAQLVETDVRPPYLGRQGGGRHVRPVRPAGPHCGNGGGCGLSFGAQSRDRAGPDEAPGQSRSL